MDAVQEVRDAYTGSEPILRGLDGYLGGQFAAYCDDKPFQFKHRVKELPSVAAKLQQGRYESWFDLDDLVAFTVVVPTRSRETEVIEWLNTSFDLQTIRSRSTAQKPPDTFRFDATRWYGRVKPSALVLPEYEHFGRFTFEVQIKTVFEDAWSAVTHDVVYKGDEPSWGKLRLASQLKAAVEQLDELVDHFEAAADQIPSSPHRETELIVANLAKIRALFEDGHLSDDLLPNSWTSMINNLWSFSRSQKTTDGDGYRRPDRVFPQIVAEFDAAVRAGEFEPLLSATLFDSIIACAITRGIASGDEFLLVSSEIVATAYQVHVARPINLTIDPATE